MAWTKTYRGAEPIRLNKWLAQEGVCSRREAEALIARGQVQVGSTTVAEPGHKISPGEAVSLNDTATKSLGAQITAVLHKPVGYVSAQPEGAQVPAARLVTKSNLIGEASSIPGARASLAPLGRLDQDSRGLLLLSEDGVLAKAVIGPDSVLEKEYLVRVRGDVTESRIRKLRHGLELDGRKLKPAKVTAIKGGVLRFILQEGRKRQIRRMCQLVELDVLDLLRVRIGRVRLDNVPEGKWRVLTEVERASLISDAAPLGKPRPGSPAKQARTASSSAGPPRGSGGSGSGKQKARGNRPDERPSRAQSHRPKR